jgi:sugar phosphate isomerase/epimerase
MKQRITRRHFIGNSGAVLAAATVGLCTQRTHAISRPAWSVGCRDAHLKVVGARDCWGALEAIGGESVEASIADDLSCPGLFRPDGHYSVADRAGISRLKKDAEASGLRIAALCMANRFDVRPDFEVEWCTKAALAAQEMGVPAIRIDVVPGRRERGQPFTEQMEAEFLDRAIATLRKVMRATEGTGVSFGIENHGGVTNKREFLLSLFEGVGSDRLGLTLDTANFYWFGYPLSVLYQLYETFAPRVFHTHCKSIRYPESEREKQRPQGWEYGTYNCPIDEGDIDFARVVEILRNAGYQNDLCIEDESLGKVPEAERKEVLARQVRFLKSLRAQ